MHLRVFLLIFEYCTMLFLIILFLTYSLLHKASQALVAVVLPSAAPGAGFLPIPRQGKV